MQVARIKDEPTTLLQIDFFWQMLPKGTDTKVVSHAIKNTSVVTPGLY